jgi:hypothetical protein
MSYVSTQRCCIRHTASLLCWGGQIGENEFTGNVADNYEWDAIGEKVDHQATRPCPLHEATLRLR